MYKDKITLECSLHNLSYEFPRNWDELHLKQMCPVCQQEETKKWKSKFDEMKSDRDKLISVIEIKLNSETNSSL